MQPSNVILWCRELESTPCWTHPHPPVVLYLHIYSTYLKVIIEMNWIYCLTKRNKYKEILLQTWPNYNFILKPSLIRRPWYPTNFAPRCPTKHLGACRIIRLFLKDFIQFFGYYFGYYQYILSLFQVTTWRQKSWRRTLHLFTIGLLKLSILLMLNEPYSLILTTNLESKRFVVSVLDLVI